MGIFSFCVLSLILFWPSVSLWRVCMSLCAVADSLPWHFQCTHIHSAPLAFWPAICPFSTMHCGIPLLNPRVKIEVYVPCSHNEYLSSQRPVTHPNYPPPPKPPVTPRTLLKEDGKVLEEGDGGIWPCERLCVHARVCVWSHADRRYATSHMQRRALARKSHGACTNQRRHRAALQRMI